MDNLCHSLMGAALASAGLGRRTALGATTLVIGANLPDLDALSYLGADDTVALAFRRGWTHGVVAMIVLPALLAASMAAVGSAVRRRRARPPGATGDPGIRPGQLLLLAAIGVWSHPLLDLLNTYGVRLLMPFSDRWFYGDTLFIVDPWLWLMLGVGAAASAVRRRRFVPSGSPARSGAAHSRPARIALALAAVYVGAMAVSSAVGRRAIERQVAGGPAARTMVSPAPATPFQRAVVRDVGSAYEMGRLRWTPSPVYTALAGPIPTGLDGAAARAAALTPRGERFLAWSRFPFAETEPVAGGIAVHLRDARYAAPGTDSWAAVTIVIPSAVLSARSRAPAGGARLTPNARPPYL